MSLDAAHRRLTKRICSDVGGTKPSLHDLQKAGSSAYQLLLGSTDAEGFLRNRTADRSPHQAADDPTFKIAPASRGWRVLITWSDGEEGPVIVFASRLEAEIWIARDAHDWLVRLASITPPAV